MTTTTTDITRFSGVQIDQLADDTIVATDPTTGQPVTLVQVRALADAEWEAWQPLNRDAWTAAYAVHIRGDWQAIEQARSDRRYAESTARYDAQIAALRAEQAARPEPVQVATDWTLHGPTVEVTLPHRFYDDHCNRDNHPGQLVRTMKTGVRVLLDAAAYDDMMGDATYYSDASDFGPEYLGLAASARGTVQRLTRVGRPA